MYKGIFTNEGKEVAEPYAFGYAYNELLNNEQAKRYFIEYFAVPHMVDELKLEDFAYQFTVMQILSQENVKQEFVDYFFSGNWIKVEDEND